MINLVMFNIVSNYIKRLMRYSNFHSMQQFDLGWALTAGLHYLLVWLATVSLSAATKISGRTKYKLLMW